LSDGKTRCAWGESDELMRVYHDTEWGVPERDGRKLWEKLILDGFQAGLSWRTILARRDAFRRAFEGFDPVRVAAYGPDDVARLLGDAGIIRSRTKIGAAINNAGAYLAMQAGGEDFARFCWDAVDGQPLLWEGPVPPNSPLSERVSKALRQRGFTFVGPTIVFAWMEATGLINSHVPACYRRAEVARKTLRDNG
jgi:DNA-3-methyladenine glycosylase I